MFDFFVVFFFMSEEKVEKKNSQIESKKVARGKDLRRRVMKRRGEENNT